MKLIKIMCFLSSTLYIIQLWDGIYKLRGGDTLYIGSSNYHTSRLVENNNIKSDDKLAITT